MTDRHFHKRACVRCALVSWTSVPLDKDYICASCKRAAGHRGTGRQGEGLYSSMAITKIVVTHGTCLTCPREDQELVNGRCDSCRWYDDIHDIDAELSARARRGKGGVNDFVRKART